jgi:hypothetical protein
MRLRFTYCAKINLRLRSLIEISQFRLTLQTARQCADCSTLLQDTRHGKLTGSSCPAAASCSGRKPTHKTRSIRALLCPLTNDYRTTAGVPARAGCVFARHEGTTSSFSSQGSCSRLRGELVCFRKKELQDWRGVRPAVADNEIDCRCIAFKGPADDRPWQQVGCVLRHQR